MEQVWIWGRVSELVLLTVWWYASFAASRLTRAPVRSALRRRAGRVAGWIVVGTVLFGCMTTVSAALWATGANLWSGTLSLPWMMAGGAALVTAFRSHPQLLSVSHYEYDLFKDERVAATAPRTIMPIQSTAVLIAVACGWSWFGPGVVLPAAGVLSLGALWALQRHRHAAARLDEWTKPKSFNSWLRSGAKRVFAFNRSNG